jgi:sigma-B regulation protein RsbU (phosphoserine phosphatase)
VFPVVKFDLGKGHLLMFSDGVTEGYIAEGKEMGMAGLLDTLKSNIDQPPRQQLNAIVDQFKQSATEQRDDITVMVLEHVGQGVQQLLSYEFTSKPAELQCMRQQLRDILLEHDCNKACVDRLILAVNEAAMNIIQHAYNYDSNGKIRLEIQRQENELIFRLTDFACPIDRSCVKSRDLKDIRPGGLGVHFINEIMDEVKFQDDCKQAGNILLMRKNLDEFCLSKKGDKQ